MKPDKCEFHMQEVKYLGLIVGAEGIKMDKAKVEFIKEWLTAKHLHDVQCYGSQAHKVAEGSRRR